MILDMLVYDGKPEKAICTVVETETKTYRVVETLFSLSGIVRIPCEVRPRTYYTFLGLLIKME